MFYVFTRTTIFTRPTSLLILVAAFGCSAFAEPAHAQLAAETFDRGEFTLHYGQRQHLTPVVFEGAHVAIRPVCTERTEGVSCGFRITALSNRLALVRARSVTLMADGERTTHSAQGYLTQTDAGQDIELLAFQVSDAVFARTAEARTVELHIGPDIVVRYDADRTDIAALLALHNDQAPTARRWPQR